MRRHGIKILGLSLLAALGLMAMSVSAAQAEGHFLILETPGGVTKETGTATWTSGTWKFLFASGLTLVCTAASATATLETKGMLGMTAGFSGCSFEGSKFCKVFPTKGDMTGKTNAGKFTATFLGLVLLHGGKHYLHVQGLGEAKSFTTLYTNTAAEGCSLPLENQFTGLDILALPNALTHSVSQVIRKATPEELTALATLGIKPALKYGSETITLDAPEITNARLTGADEGKLWGAL